MDNELQIIKDNVEAYQEWKQFNTLSEPKLFEKIKDLISEAVKENEDIDLVSQRKGYVQTFIVKIKNSYHYPECLIINFTVREGITLEWSKGDSDVTPKIFFQHYQQIWYGGWLDSEGYLPKTEVNKLTNKRLVMLINQAFEGVMEKIGFPVTQTKLSQLEQLENNIKTLLTNEQIRSLEEVELELKKMRVLILDAYANTTDNEQLKEKVQKYKELSGISEVWES